MGVRRDDPRTEAQKKFDDEVRQAVEENSLPKASKVVRQKAIDLARKKHLARQAAAKVGLELGCLRRCFSITQEEIAEAIGTKRSDISRIEKGDYGGLTIERLFLILSTIAEHEAISIDTLLERNKSKLSVMPISMYDDKVLYPEESVCEIKGEEHAKQ